MATTTRGDIKYVGGGAIAPYTPAVIANGFVFCSGQIGMNPDGTLVEGGIGEQTKKAMERVTNLLKDAGSDINKVVKVTVFLSGSMAHFDEVNSIYKTYFQEPFPARSCVAVAALPKGALVEIEVLALQ